MVWNLSDELVSYLSSFCSVHRISTFLIFPFASQIQSAISSAYFSPGVFTVNICFPCVMWPFPSSTEVPRHLTSHVVPLLCAPTIAEPVWNSLLLTISLQKNSLIVFCHLALSTTAATSDLLHFSGANMTVWSGVIKSSEVSDNCGGGEWCNGAEGCNGGEEPSIGKEGWGRE